MTQELASEQVIIQSPMSFVGSARRIWKITQLTDNTWGRLGLQVLAVALISVAWMFVAAWLLTWGLLVVPWRLLRRGQRRRKQERLRHEETLRAVAALDRRMEPEVD